MALLALPALATRPARSIAVENATLTSRVDLSDVMALLRVRPDAGVPTFHPGQYFALGLVIDSRVVQRPYSAAAASVALRELEFLVRLVPGGQLTPRLWDLRPGSRLRIGPPKGIFTLLPSDERTHLFVSTGSGLAPFIAMVDALQRRSRSPRIAVIHGASHVAELAYHRWLAARAGGERSKAITYLPVISRPSEPPNAGWHGAVGRIDSVLPQAWAELRLDPHATVAYLCGNPGMIEGGIRVLTAHGLSLDAIRYEEYWARDATRERA